MNNRIFDQTASIPAQLAWKFVFTSMTVTKRKVDRKTRALRKFLSCFPKGFYDQKYLDWERGYKWDAHLAWKKNLGKSEFQGLLENEDYHEAALRAIRIESQTNLLFSFEKMALRDAVKSDNGARLFAEGLYDLVYGTGDTRERFLRFVTTVGKLPRKQTRVLTWPLVTVFGFIADPKKFIFLKPRVTQAAAEFYGYDFHYSSKPSWETYHSLLEFAQRIRKDHPKLKPRDFIDLQSCIWVLGSSEYD